MATFSAVLLTAPPPGEPAESGAFVKIDGREVLLRAVELFLNRENIRQIQVCFLPADLETAKRRYGAHLSFAGVKVFSAGPGWAEQISAAVPRIAELCTHVIVHDAARAAVAYNDIDALLELAEKHPAVALAAPVHGSLVEVDEGGKAVAIRPGDRYMRLLTPWAMSRAAFAGMASGGGRPDASQFAILKASPLNVRMNSPGDAALVKAMLQLLPKPRVKPPSSPFEEAQW